MQLDLLSGAENDLFEAIEYFQDLEVSVDFHQRITSLLGLVKDFPYMGRHYKAGFRVVFELRYQYGIYYKVHGNRIAVAAIVPQRDDPKFLHRRLKLD